MTIELVRASEAGVCENCGREINAGEEYVRVICENEHVRMICARELVAGVCSRAGAPIGRGNTQGGKAK